MNAALLTPRRAAFLDRDGVINLDHGYVFRQQDFEFVPGTLTAARRLHEAGWVLVVVTNQSGIGRGLYTEADYRALDAWMRAEFAAAGAPLAATYFCPHHPRDALGAYRRECDCRPTSSSSRCTRGPRSARGSARSPKATFSSMRRWGKSA